MSPHSSDPAAIDYQKCIDAIRNGGFVCLLPQPIDPSWRDPAPLLAGFPISVGYTGLSNQVANRPNPPLMTSSYWFDPATYREDNETRAMSYFTNPRCQYHVELVYSKKKRRWEGSKRRAGTLRLTAEGSDLRKFIIQLTLCGIESDEPTQVMRTYADTASVGMFLFSSGPMAHGSKSGGGRARKGAA